MEPVARQCSPRTHTVDLLEEDLELGGAPFENGRKLYKAIQYLYIEILTDSGRKSASFQVAEGQLRNDNEVP